MNIGIDARLLNKKITGINRVLWNFIKNIPQFDSKNRYFLYSYDDSEFNDKFYTHIKIPRSRFARQIYEHYWLNFKLPGLLAEQKIDLFFTPYFLVPLKKENYKNIIVIHDVMTKACRKYFTYHYRKYMDIVVPAAIKRSDAIITISESSRQDILKYYNVYPEKVHCIHLWTDEKYKPYSFSKAEKENFLKKFGLPEKFILFVGAIEERKNIRGILKISDMLLSRGLDIKFVLIGEKSFGFKELYEEILKRKTRVIYLNYVNEQDLPVLYSSAAIFLFPSYYEGFGLPPLEAMKCGTPVLSSNNSSLPEVVGDGGMQFNAGDYDSFAESIIKLLKNEDFYALMSAKAIEQSKKFTPESQMPKLMSLFNSMS